MMTKLNSASAYLIRQVSSRNPLINLCLDHSTVHGEEIWTMVIVSHQNVSYIVTDRTSIAINQTNFPPIYSVLMGNEVTN